MAEEPFEDLVEPAEEELEEQQQPDLLDQAQDLKDKADQAKDLHGKVKERFAPKTPGSAEGSEEAGKRGLREGVERKTAENAKRKVLTRGAQEVTKAGARTAAEAGTEAVAIGGAEVAAGAGTAAVVGGEALAGPPGWIAAAVTLLTVFGGKIWQKIKEKEVWKWPVYIVGGLLIILATVFGLFGGKFAPQYPSTIGQQRQAVLAAALGDDIISQRKLNQTTVDIEKKRYQYVQTNVDRDLPDRSADVKLKIKEITSLMDQAVLLSGAAKKQMVDTIISKIVALDSTLPFGNWIAKIAEQDVGHLSTEFCAVSGASASHACASFVSTVLQQAGVPIPIEAAVDQIWLGRALRIVVDRPAIKSAGYYDQNKSKLQRGDIIFWGDGSCGSGSGSSKLFSHIGIYVGNGLAIDNSSSKEQIRKPTNAAARDRNCRFFNGAKRYGANS